MPSSDRSDENGPGGKAPAGAAEPAEGKPAPIERSPRGRVIIRSSSHPPVGERGGDARDVSGARALPASERGPAPEDRDEGPEARSKRSTPAERPRRRRKVQAERAAGELAGITSARMTGGAERPHHFAGSRRNTPDRAAGARAEQSAITPATARAARARRIAIAVAIAILLGVALWALRR